MQVIISVLRRSYGYAGASVFGRWQETSHFLHLIFMDFLNAFMAGNFFPYLMMAPAYLRGEIESLGWSSNHFDSEAVIFSVRGTVAETPIWLISWWRYGSFIQAKFAFHMVESLSCTFANWHILHFWLWMNTLYLGVPCLSWCPTLTRSRNGDMDQWELVSSVSSWRLKWNKILIGAITNVMHAVTVLMFFWSYVLLSSFCCPIER